jgi:hypothetical protein
MAKRPSRAGGAARSRSASRAKPPREHVASAEGFTARRPGDGPLFMMGVPLGERLPEPALATAARVTLRKGDEQVLVHPLERRADGSFVGRIEAFEPSAGKVLGDLAVGDHVVFEEAHVFAARR